MTEPGDEGRELGPGAPVPEGAGGEPETAVAPSAEAPPPEPDPLAEARRQCEELKDQLLRKRAEFENYRRRAERDRQQAAWEATAAILKGVVPTLDNLERALAAGGGEGGLREGVELTYRDLVAFLESQGVARVDPTGRRFDPAFHEALAHEVVPGYEEGMVVTVFRKGYTFGERLLRPALVRVAAGGGSGEALPSAGGPEALH